MKVLSLVLSVFLCIPVHGKETTDDEQECLTFIKLKENYKVAHKNKSCERAANEGVASAQYSVGMGYGFDGNSELEEKYYLLAANNKGVAAYLSLGHIYSKGNPWKAIYWYQRYISVKQEGGEFGYAAKRISQIFDEELGDTAQANYWNAVCKSSPYKGC